MKEQLVYLGVDIAKAYLDAAIGNKEHRFSNALALTATLRKLLIALNNSLKNDLTYA